MEIKQKRQNESEWKKGGWRARESKWVSEEDGARKITLFWINWKYGEKTEMAFRILKIIYSSPNIFLIRLADTAVL